MAPQCFAVVDVEPQSPVFADEANNVRPFGRVGRPYDQERKIRRRRRARSGRTGTVSIDDQHIASGDIVTAFRNVAQVTDAHGNELPLQVCQRAGEIALRAHADHEVASIRASRRPIGKSNEIRDVLGLDRSEIRLRERARLHERGGEQHCEDACLAHHSSGADTCIAGKRGESTGLEERTAAVSSGAFEASAVDETAAVAKHLGETRRVEGCSEIIEPIEKATRRAGMDLIVFIGRFV